MTTSVSLPVATLNSQAQLLEGCRFCITQCELLVQTLSPEDFTAAENGASVGSHLRHVVERFQCFFNGLSSRHIEYDERKRDQSIANNLDAASFAFASIRNRLESIENLDPVFHVLSVQELVHRQGPPVSCSSTLGRELMGLISHTTHHLAIVAPLVKSMGYELDQDFGKAPSTIRHERLGPMA